MKPSGEPPSVFDDLIGDVHLIVRIGAVALVLAFIAILLLSVFSLKLYGDLRSVVDERTLEAQRNNENTVDRCFSAAAQAPGFRNVLESLKKEAKSPTLRNQLEALRLTTLRTAPTLKECRDLARDLNVNAKGMGR